jgi:hypothetical protein
MQTTMTTAMTTTKTTTTAAMTTTKTRTTTKTSPSRWTCSGPYSTLVSCYGAFSLCYFAAFNHPDLLVPLPTNLTMIHHHARPERHAPPPRTTAATRPPRSNHRDPTQPPSIATHDPNATRHRHNLTATRPPFTITTPDRSAHCHATLTY